MCCSAREENLGTPESRLSAAKSIIITAEVAHDDLPSTQLDYRIWQAHIPTGPRTHKAEKHKLRREYELGMQAGLGKQSRTWQAGGDTNF